MVKSIFASKIGMTQAWDISGKRWAVTRLNVQPNVVLGMQTTNDQHKLLIGYGNKKLKNMAKPLRSIVEKSGFTFGVRQIKGVTPVNPEPVQPGTIISLADVLTVGSVVNVQGVTKGRGFAGAVKRHGFHGGPKTHGQSDRERAVGSIGAGTTPGRVLKGKRMPGHYGVETQTVKGLVVLFVDSKNNEVWLSGPVPGSLTATVMISPTGMTKEVALDLNASGVTPVEPVTEEVAAEVSPVETTEQTTEVKEEVKE